MHIPHVHTLHTKPMNAHCNNYYYYYYYYTHHWKLSTRRPERLSTVYIVRWRRTRGIASNTWRTCIIPNMKVVMTNDVNYMYQTSGSLVACIGEAAH